MAALSIVQGLHSDLIHGYKKTWCVMNLPTIVLGIVATTLTVYGCSGPNRFRELDSEALLRESGRVVCASGTFEASGTISTVRDGKPCTERVRWVFGPNGEYRLEFGPRTVVHDGEYVYWCSATSAETSVMRTKTILGRTGPRRRYPGDLVMVAGFASELAMTFPEAVQRLSGKAWVSDLVQSRAYEVEKGVDTVLNGRACRITTLRISDEGEMRAWIDLESGLIRKWVGNGTDSSICIEYERAEAGVKLDGSEFAIPCDKIEEFERELASQGN